MAENTKRISIIGIIVTIIIGLPAIYFSVNTLRKNLSYQIISYYTTSYKTKETGDSLRFFYNSKEIENLHSLLIEFVNKGSEPIRSDDFEGDLEIKFCTNTKILRFEIVETTPANINVQYVICDSIIKIKPTLINPNDRIRAMAILTGEDSKPQIYGRIAGIKEVEEFYNIQVEYHRCTFKTWCEGIGGFLLLILSTVAVLFFIIERNFLKKIISYFCLILFFGSGWSLLGYWGENINFMLPTWINYILLILFFPLLVWLFYKIYKIRMLKKSG